MSTHTEDLIVSSTASGLVSLLRLLQAVELEKVPSAVNLQLTFSPQENGSGTWHLKKAIVERLSD